MITPCLNTLIYMNTYNGSIYISVKARRWQLTRKSNSEKEAILMESFDILKENVEKHRSKLAELIGKMAEFNLNETVKMWKYVVKQAGDSIKVDGYYYTGNIIYNINQNVGMNELIRVLKENEDLVDVCFGVSNDVDDYFVSSLIRRGEIELTDKILSLIHSNPNIDEPFSNYLEMICEAFVKEFEELLEDNEDEEDYTSYRELANKGGALLSKWVNQISDSESKARLNVTLLDYV